MGFFHWLITHIAPLFIITSPITSYADQIYSMHRTRTSAGFSLDIPLIMLLASILKIFYWLGARFDYSLLFQAVLMIIMQTFLLYMALLHQPPPTVTHAPFSDSKQQAFAVFSRRPYNFWQWRTQRPYWTFLLYFTITLVALQILIGSSSAYTQAQGYMGLAIEATLPLPQIIANQRRRGCKGFRLSVIANWLIGDAFKMIFFFAKGRHDVPWAFKLCGIFQALCDLYLGLQYYIFGDGELTQPWDSSKQAQEMNWTPVHTQTQPQPPAAAVEQ